MMRSWRRLALGLAGVCLLWLTGCEYTKTYVNSSCSGPPDTSGQPGTVSMTADVPTKLEAGETFTITVQEIGVALGESEDPPPADTARFLNIGAQPVEVVLGSVADPVQWPQEITLTVTGQPGEHVLFGVMGAGRQDGTPPDAYELSCDTGSSETHGLFATIPIEEPAP